MAEIRSKRQIKQEAKNRLEQIKQSLKRIQKTHLAVWVVSCVFWLTMVIICNKELDCRAHWEDIVHLAEERYSNMATLTYHKSIEVAYAEELENEHIENMRKDNCITKQNKTYYTIEVDGDMIEVLGSTIDILIVDGVDVVENNSLDKVNGLDTDNQKINYRDGQAYSYNQIIVKDNQFKKEAHNDRCYMCTPLPYRSKTPIALEYYSPLHWWDLFMLTVAGIIQFRLKSIEDGDGYGSFGPLVVDEKDIAMTSVQLLAIIMTTAFYSVELTMSALWLTLHNNQDLDIEHTSHYTVLERNEMLTVFNSIWIVLLMPLFVIAYKIKLQIQKYEQNQFLTEL